MKTFEFTIIASGLDPAAEDFETRFYEAGCDDATIAFQKGHIIVDFARDAPSIEDAIASAVENVQSTGAIVDRIEPDPLVSISDIAARAKMTRAAISLYAKGERGRGFPPAVARVTSDSPLWDWAKVAAWLFRQGRLPQDDVVAALAVAEANTLISAGAVVASGTIRERVSRFQRGAAA